MLLSFNLNLSICLWHVVVGSVPDGGIPQLILFSLPSSDTVIRYDAWSGTSGSLVKSCDCKFMRPASEIVLRIPSSSTGSNERSILFASFAPPCVVSL